MNTDNILIFALGLALVLWTIKKTGKQDEPGAKKTESGSKLDILPGGGVFVPGMSFKPKF